MLKLRPDDLQTAREVLGYLNFSEGRPDPAFLKGLNALIKRVGWSKFPATMTELIAETSASSPAFRNSQQAEATLRLTFDHVLPAYREHHRDLLSHLTDADFENPFFLGRVFEAVLEQGSPWDESERITQGALKKLNDFLGYRPLAVLENGRQMEPYPHERLRPFPLYVRGAGVAIGPYESVISKALDLMETVPADLREDAHFSLELMDEMALDPRAHDHLHPVNKRTNYLFGEWDPHTLDVSGRYRRFIIRKIILDALLAWLATQKRAPKEESLFDAGAVLCGTILMASSISGSSPETHDSSVTLTTLLPKVARQRDAFYQRLMAGVSGKRAKRLARHAKVTHQPFGHVRQFLNMFLAQYGAQQVQRRHLSYLFARLGFADAARHQAEVIPCAAARFECEIQWRTTAAKTTTESGDLAQGAAWLAEADDLLHRGIECGAIVDPWNILGFQGQFPLFSSREDSVPDQRIETLLQLMESLFSAATQLLVEASARGDTPLAAMISDRFERLAEFWDRFATTTVSDLEPVFGRRSFESAQHVARALADWRAAGEAAGDISFWKRQVDQFQSAKAYAQVVSALLDRHDLVASLGLLMQWLSQVEDVGLEAGSLSFDRLVLRWMQQVISSSVGSAQQLVLTRRLFDSLEANAGDYWDAPELTAATAGAPPLQLGEKFDEEEDDDNESDLFNAAYENLTFRDSTDDGYEGETLDWSPPRSGHGEFERLEKTLEPRIKFLKLLTQLWQMAAVLFAEEPSMPGERPGNAPSLIESLQGWHQHAKKLQADLERLLADLWALPIHESSGDYDANVEYDVQLQTKLYLVQTVISTYVSCRAAQWHLAAALLPADQQAAAPLEERRIIEVFRAVARRDVAEVRRLLPGLLRHLQKRPLLYVPLDHGGEPQQMLTARIAQAVVKFLLAALPRLGLLRETWHLLRTAHMMERVSRPQGIAVTEFDRLFRIGLKNSLTCVVESSRRWKSGRFSDEELIEVIGSVVEFYLEQWLDHSQTMRLSTVESLKSAGEWNATREFVRKYGGDLLNARTLTLGNIRTILHHGVDKFLEYLDETEDPLHPSPLLEDIRRGVITQDEVSHQLSLIYQITVERFDRFLEYNTTTTQSDYGELFNSLLDFLRLETAYDRDSWNLLPVSLAHEVLVRNSKDEAAVVWEEVFETKTELMAEQHLEELHRLERKYGMRLPSVANHLQERFVKPLMVNTMVATLARAAEESRQRGAASEAFRSLVELAEEYLKTSMGSGLEIPAWLRTLEEEVNRIQQTGDTASGDQELLIRLGDAPLNLRELRLQLRTWQQPLTPRNSKS
jgi:hypothetical protein